MNVKSVIGALAAAGILLAVPALAHAGQLTWSGNVDDRMLITIHRADVSNSPISGKDATDVAIHLDGRLRETETNFRMIGYDGRGIVRVVRMPDADNDYTAVIRIDDPQGGRGFYRFTVAWDGDDAAPIDH